MHTPAPHTIEPAEYQRLPAVVERARESCGLDDARHGQCVYLATMSRDHGPHPTWGDAEPEPPAHLGAMFARGHDVTRSMWDTGSLIVYIDLDYLDPGDPGGPYLHPADAFLCVEPVWRTLHDQARRHHLHLLDLMTGAGYAFVGRVPRHGLAARWLAALAPETPAWWYSHAQRRPAWTLDALPEADARAHLGLSLVLEHLAHRVIASHPADAPVPVVLDNTEVGRGTHGRACVSVDLTHFGDPLDARHLRVAYGVYQKHRLRPDIFGAQAAAVPPLAVVPRRGHGLLETLAVSRDLSRAAHAAVLDRTDLPDCTRGIMRLLAEYERSALAAFHRTYLAPRVGTPPTDETVLRSLDPETLPPCVAACLRQPNDLLLKPAHLQNLVRVLMARGWPARRIADLVLAHYRRDGAWGDHWRRVDPETRAYHDVRVFAGMVATGLDRGLDLNCVSTQEKGMCPRRLCGLDLRRERDQLLARRTP